MTLTGRQIREARAKLGWKPRNSARRAGLSATIIKRAEASDGEAVVTTVQIAALRLIFMKAGLEFGPESDGAAGMRLRKGESGI